MHYNRSVSKMLSNIQSRNPIKSKFQNVTKETTKAKKSKLQDDYVSNNHCWKHIDGINVPFIFRKKAPNNWDDIPSEKRNRFLYVEINMLNNTLFHVYQSTFLETAFDFLQPNRKKVSKFQQRVLNKIKQHMFIQQPCSAYVISYSEAMSWYRFLHNAYHILVNKKNVQMQNYGFVRLEGSDTPIPFIQIKQSMVVPAFFLDIDERKQSKWTLKNHWQLAYLKLFCKMLKINKSLWDKPTLDVVSLSQKTLIYFDIRTFYIYKTVPVFSPQDFLKTEFIQIPLEDNCKETCKTSLENDNTFSKLRVSNMVEEDEYFVVTLKDNINDNIQTTPTPTALNIEPRDRKIDVENISLGSQYIKKEVKTELDVQEHSNMSVISLANIPLVPETDNFIEYKRPKEEECVSKNEYLKNEHDLIMSEVLNKDINTSKNETCSGVSKHKMEHDLTQSSDTDAVNNFIYARSSLIHENETKESKEISQNFSVKQEENENVLDISQVKVSSDDLEHSNFFVPTAESIPVKNEQDEIMFDNNQQIVENLMDFSSTLQDFSEESKSLDKIFKHEECQISSMEHKEFNTPGFEFVEGANKIILYSLPTQPKIKINSNYKNIKRYIGKKKQKQRPPKKLPTLLPKTVVTVTVPKLPLSILHDIKSDDNTNTNINESKNKQCAHNRPDMLQPSELIYKNVTTDNGVKDEKHNDLSNSDVLQDSSISTTVTHSCTITSDSQTSSTCSSHIPSIPFNIVSQTNMTPNILNLPPATPNVLPTIMSHPNLYNITQTIFQMPNGMLVIGPMGMIAQNTDNTNIILTDNNLSSSTNVVTQAQPHFDSSGISTMETTHMTDSSRSVAILPGT